MNDLLIKDVMISDTFLASLHKRKEDSVSDLYTNYTIFCAIAFSVGFQLLFAAISQYNNTANNILTFTKLNHQAIYGIIETLQSFQDSLQGNIYLEKTLLENSLIFPRNYMENTHNHINKRTSARTKTQDSQHNKYGFNYNSLTRELFSVIFRGLVNLSIMLALMTLYLLLIRGAFQDLSKTADQIYFIKSLDSKIALLRNGFFELAATNNTAFIRGMIVETAIEDELESISKMQNQLYTRFSDSDLDLVKDIVFSDACESLINPNQMSYYQSCKVLGNNLDKISLINLVNNIMALYQDFLNKYHQSDKSPASLKALQIQVYRQLSSPVYIVIQPLTLMISEALNEDFMSNVSACNSLNVVLLVLISLDLLGTFWFTKVFIINNLLQKENEFRRMLLFFPANVVLSNFMLKSYLTRTTKSFSVDLTRNEL